MCIKVKSRLIWLKQNINNTNKLKFMDNQTE